MQGTDWTKTTGSSGTDTEHFHYYDHNGEETGTGYHTDGRAAAPPEKSFWEQVGGAIDAAGDYLDQTFRYTVDTLENVDPEATLEALGLTVADVLASTFMDSTYFDSAKEDAWARSGLGDTYIPQITEIGLTFAREAGLAYASGGLSLLGRTGSILLRVGLFGREVYEGTTNAYAGTQALMDGKPLTAAYHYGLTVLNLFGMKNAKGALDDAAEMLAPVFKKPQVVAKAETPQAKVFVNRAQSLLSRAGDVTRDDILGALEGLTKQADRIAAAIRGGDLQLNVLSDKLFDLAWRLKHGEGAAPQAFAYGEQLFVRRGSSNFLSEIVHEGTHGLDYLDNLTGTRRFFEKRAYYFERQFQLAGGGYLEFETLTDMLAHIFTYY